MYNKFYTWLERMAFLSDSQYGFRKGLDTTDALLNFMHECHQSLHRRSHLVAVFRSVKGIRYGQCEYSAQ